MKFILKFFLLLPLALNIPGSFADTYTNRRIQTGSKIFRTLVAADMNLDNKIDAEGRLLFALVYSNDPEGSHIAEKTLELATSTIQERPIKIIRLSLSRLKNQNNIAAILITQRLEVEELHSIIAYSKKNRIILYSPFEGDVEKGVSAGLSVEARVRPYLNQAALEAAGIRIKPFFLKVSKLYE